MEGAEWYDWLALILVVILVVLLVAFKYFLSLFPPTMPVGMASLILWGIILVLIITIVALLAAGADPFKPLAKTFEKAADAIGDIIGSAAGALSKGFSRALVPLLAIGAAAFALFRIFPTGSSRPVMLGSINAVDEKESNTGLKKELEDDS